MKRCIAFLLLLTVFAHGAEEVLDSSGKATGKHGIKPGVPVWGFTAVYAEDDHFVIFY